MKIPMTHSYHEALTVIALLRIVNSKTLTLLFQDHTVRAHFVKKALSRKHIRKTTVQERVNGERKSLTLFSITKRGLDEIAHRDAALYELLSHQPSISVFNRVESKASVRLKLASVSNTVVMAYSAGAVIPPSTFGSIQSDALESEDDDAEAADDSKLDQPYTLKDFFRDYLDENSLPALGVFEEAHSPQDNDYLIFHERGTVKSMLSLESERGETRDFQSGRYTGILESHFKTVMMYVAPLYTMPWSRWLLDAEMNAYRMWGRTYSITDIRRQSRNQTMAAVIVNNAHDFAYHFSGIKRKREKGELFGGSFAHVYVIPNDQNGIRFLNWLMLIEDDAIQHEMAELAIQSGDFAENNTRSAAQFLLRSRSGVETAVLLTMDAKQMNAIQYYAKERKEQKLQVICFDWQEDYLRRVLPANVSFWPISSDLTRE